MSFKRATTVTVTSALLLGLHGLPASADPHSFNETTDASHASSFLKAQGVSDVTASKLEQKIRSGQATGSVAGEQLIEVETKRQGDFIVTAEKYSDGSVETIRIEQPIQPLASKKGCKLVSGSGYRTYKNCTISRQSINGYIAFLATYTLVQGAPDYISSATNLVQRCFIGSCSNESLRIRQKKEANGNSARAEARVVITLPNNVGSRSHGVRLLVGKDQARAVDFA